MQIKSILIAIAAASLALTSPAFADTAEMTGTVVSVTSTMITLQKGTEMWDIKRTATTKVVSGTLKPASTVTVSYDTIDAQKKESPVSAGTPTPAAQ